MTRQPKAEWVAQLRELCGPSADIRFNDALGRWEFLIPSADGVPRSQFWGWFNQPINPTTGLHPFRELDDDGMRVALHNLTVSFVGNPRAEMLSRMRYNRDVQEAARRQRAEDYEYYITRESRRQIHRVPQILVTSDL